MLFAGEVFGMYRALAARRGWAWTAFQLEEGPQGGLRSAVALVEGECVYRLLRFEAGVHRVQRIPATDPSRMHTSTMSVAVLAEPEKVGGARPDAHPAGRGGGALARVQAGDHARLGAGRPEREQAVQRGAHHARPLGHRRALHAGALPAPEHPGECGCRTLGATRRWLQLAYQRLAALLLQQKLDKLLSSVSSARKLQVGSLARAEKVRTFNFQHGRVTDHRLKMSTSDLAGFLAGGPPLEQFMAELQRLHLLDRLEDELAQAPGQAAASRSARGLTTSPTRCSC